LSSAWEAGHGIIHHQERKHPEHGEVVLQQYATHLREVDDLHANTIRGYLSDLRQFVAWYESSWDEGQDEGVSFTPTALTTPTLTRYRSYLQATLRLRPTTINRALITLKRYCKWLLATSQIPRDPAIPVKLVPSTTKSPRQLTDTEEEALVAAVTQHGSLRDQTIIRLMLHTGLRAHEVCQLRRDQVTIGRRSGTLTVYGKRNKYREVPLNRTARTALEEYLPTCLDQSVYLFPSEKMGVALTPRALGYIIQKYAALARLANLSPHDLRHRFGYRMAEVVPLHRLAQIMGHDSLDMTLLYVQPTQRDLQNEVEKIAWA
jgi:integrase/recombinase XerD